MTKILTLSLNLYALATRYFLSVFIRPGLDSLDLHYRFSWFLHDMLRLSHTHAHKHNHTLIFYEYQQATIASLLDHTEKSFDSGFLQL